MRKTILTLTLSVLALVTMAGGIVHNTNQSASFIRMPARDASLGLDATYFNPAGMSYLKDGFHLSLSNQYITQNRNIKTNYPGLNRSEFEGKVVAPLFPAVYAVYKKGNFAAALSFNPIGGGGGALFEDGLPSFEMQVSSLPSMLTVGGIPTTQYSYETEFEGKSIYYGIQGAVSYKINDMISVALGLRYVSMKNSYVGYLRNIQVNPQFPALNFSGSMVSAPQFFTALSGYLGTVSQQLGATGSALQPIIDGGAGQVPLSSGTQAGLTAAQVATLQGTITALGGDPTNMTIAQAQGFFAGASAQYASQSAGMSANATATGDKEVDATQSGSGIVPIVGVNLHFDRLNVGIKYEHKASVKVKNSTKVDDVGMFPDGAEVPSDMPSMLSVGAAFDATKKLKVSAGLHAYFDKGAEYGKMIDGVYVKNDQVMDKNFMEYALGLEYALTEKWLISVGYLATRTGVKDIYQSDLSHSLSTNSFGGGLQYKITEKIAIDLGVLNTSYTEATRDFPAVAPKPAFTETYNRHAFTAALGVDISF